MKFYQNYFKSLKTKDISPLWVYNISAKNTITYKGGYFIKNSIYHSELLFNCLKKLNLFQFSPQTAMKHIMAILASVLSLRYYGKIIDFEKYTLLHHTTIFYFLNKENGMMTDWKTYSKALLSRSSIRKPSNLENLCSALWITSSLPKQNLCHRLCIQLKICISTNHISKGSRTIGINQAMTVILSCNGMVLNYAIIMYDKHKSKTKIVQKIANELLISPAISYFLCDS